MYILHLLSKLTFLMKTNIVIPTHHYYTNSKVKTNIMNEVKFKHKLIQFSC